MALKKNLIYRSTGSKSPRYVAPESYELKPCTKSDVFSAGVLMSERGGFAYTLLGNT